MSASLTRAAEGFDRRAFTVDEVLRMQAAGIISEDENFELIEGEIVPMQAKTHAHELIKSTLNIAMARALPASLWLGVESTITLSPHTFVEPDLVIYPRGLELGAVRGPDIVLAVEVSQSSLAYDRGLKAQLYARHGVRELWVVDAQQRVTWIHRDPSGSRWTSITQVAPDQPLRLAELERFEVRLREA
jgi:Uma2 family endonuclease